MFLLISTRTPNLTFPSGKFPSFRLAFLLFLAIRLNNKYVLAFNFYRNLCGCSPLSEVVAKVNNILARLPELVMFTALATNMWLTSTFDRLFGGRGWLKRQLDIGGSSCGHWANVAYAQYLYYSFICSAGHGKHVLLLYICVCVCVGRKRK